MDLSELRQAIADSNDLPQEPFPTPEWPNVDGQLYVRGMGTSEQEEHEIFLANHVVPGDSDSRPMKIGTKHLRARVAVKGLVTSKGHRVFSDSEEDLATLGGKGRIVDRLYDRIRALSGIGEQAAEELEKNFETARGDSSPST